jgi:heme-degrading monooxygenase HmoA
MFVALYQFKVKAGCEQEFCQAWHDGTEGIYAARGSLGSRLHRSDDGTYLAYAQWPSAEQFDKNDELPPGTKAALARMRDCCDSIATLHRMNVIDDLLRHL